MAKNYLRLFKRSASAKRLAVFVLAFAIVGSVILIASHAASPAANVEPENGSITGPAQSRTDSTASGGGYVQFNAANNGLINRSRLGVDINDLPSGITVSHAYDVIAFLGFGWVRDGPTMTNYHNPSTGDINGFDTRIGYAQANHLKILAVLTYAYSDCSGGHCAPSDPTAWANFAGRLVAHWKTAFPGVVQAVEVWNEANNGQFWNPVDPAKYTNLLKKTYTAVKAADSGMTVVASGTAPGGGNVSASQGNSTDSPRNPATWYQELYDNGVKGSFDAAANHPYDTKNLTANTTTSGLRNTFWIRQVMNAHGESSKQIWSTEAGVVSCLKGPGSNPPFTEAQRASRLTDDLEDFWHGTHSQTDGHTLNTSATTADWNPGPYFYFKLYKSTGDSGLGLIYNTNSYMKNPPSSEVPNSGGTPEPQCTSSPDYYVPGSVAGKVGLGNVISDFSNRAQSQP